tara:strand:- start:2239 stop:4449 length:2211 start_codon:yes stop_codon:yes gene_type:complete
MVYSQLKQSNQLDDLHLQLKNSETIQKKIDVSIELGSIYLYRPESFKIDMDSATYYFDKAYKLSDSINNYDLKNRINYYLAETNFEEQNFSEAYSLYYKVIDYYKKNNLLKEEAETWLTIANRTRNEISIDNRLFEENNINYNNARNIYKNLGLKIEELGVLKDMADYHLNEGSLNLAERELLFLIEEYKKINYSEIHHTYNLLGIVNRLNGDFNKSIYNGLKSIEYMLKSNDTIYASYFYGNVADSYRELGEVQQSIIWYHKALLNWETNTYLGGGYLYRYLNYLSKQLVLSHSEKEALDLAIKVSQKIPPESSYQKGSLSRAKATALNALGQYDLAEKEYLNALKWITYDKNSNYLIFVSETNLELGEFYMERKQYNKAKSYIIQSLNVPKGIAAQAKVKDANLMLFTIDSVQGNYLEAIKYFQNYKRINDSIFNITKSRQIEELQIQYETAKKENDIKTLRNENLVQNDKLNKTTGLKNLVFIGLLVFFLISVLLYRSYMSKQKVNRLLVSQKGEIAQQNTSLHELLNEKEWLLKEIHHRVKNNLQIVMSLLNTQSNYIKSKEALSAIRNSQHRLFAISLIHQKLYKTDNTALIDMNSYIKDLANYLMDSFDVRDTIKFDLDIEHILLEEAQSIPVGLILNEAITNSIKYAFPKREKGIISVQMKKVKGSHFIVIKDNGIGLPEGFNVISKSSLGMTLIKGLTNQLDGNFEIKNENGTLIEVIFKNKPMSNKS